jgi:hypothetical protein
VKNLSGDFARAEGEVNLCLRLRFLHFATAIGGHFLRRRKKFMLREPHFAA